MRQDIESSEQKQLLSRYLLIFLASIQLKRFHLLFWCFHCWLWTSKCWLGILKWGFEHHNWLLNPSKPIKFQKCWEDWPNVKTQLDIFSIFPLLFTLMSIVYSFNGSKYLFIQQKITVLISRKLYFNFYFRYKYL